MSEDKARLSELQSALRAKMADNKTIADSFKIEDGNVVVSSAQKTAFDKNMQDIKEIKSLISGLEQMSEVDSWGSQASGESVAAAVAAGSAFSHSLRSETIGEAFLNSSEFKSLANGRNGANMPSPFQYGGSLLVLAVLVLRMHTRQCQAVSQLSSVPCSVTQSSFNQSAPSVFAICSQLAPRLLQSLNTSA